MLLLSATVSVDSFFLLSGLLVTWSVLKELDKNRWLNVPLMYLHRYLRLTPALGALMLLTVSLLPYLGDGPNWILVESYLSKTCKDHWWETLLYVQNYVNPDAIVCLLINYLLHSLIFLSSKQCLGHSWYLSVDMQLFILSPLILIPLWKWGRYTLSVIFVLIFLSMGCVFGTFYINKYSLKLLQGYNSMTSILTDNKIDVYFYSGGIGDMDRMKKIYYPTHTRMGAWLVGVVLGYILHSYRGIEIHLSKLMKTTGWIVSLGTIVAIIFGQYNIQQFNSTENLVASAFYDSCSRVTWCIALSWIIFACSKGFGGIVNWFLSLAMWIPFARLSYSLYLTHFIMQIVRAFSSKTNGYFSDLLAIERFWGDFGLSLTISVFWCLAFESPVVILEKYLIPQGLNNF